MVPGESSCNKEFISEIWKLYLFPLKKLWPRLQFWKSTRKAHAKWESHASSNEEAVTKVKDFEKNTGSEVIAKIKVFAHGHTNADTGGMTIALWAFIPVS